MQLFCGQVVYTYIFVDDGGKRNNGYLVGHLSVKSFETGNVDAGIPVAGADISDAFLHGLWSGNRTLAGSGDFHFWMQLLEFFGRLQRQRKQCSRSVNGNFTF
ncbi:hypothetical protein D3C87_1715610 [compost metagenome]